MTLKQRALGMGDPLGDTQPEGVTWDSANKMLTIPRAAAGQEGVEAKINFWVDSGGKIQKNAALTGSWTSVPFKFAAALKATRVRGRTARPRSASTPVH